MSTDSPSFSGLRVASLESRNAEEMARMIARFGGVPHVSPSMREVPLAESREAIDFAHHVITGGIDVMIFLTGVGFKHLLATVEKHVDRERFLNSLGDMVTIVRGPKPLAAMREVGLTPTHRVPEPNTWRELLATIEVGAVPIGIQMTPDGKRAFIANTNDDQVTLLSIGDRKVLKAFATGNEPDGMAWVPRTRGKPR